MNATPLVSVVIPTWNGREHLEACLAGVRRLAYPANALDLIVVDNGSTDGSVEWLRMHPEVRLVANAENLGFARACNDGTRRSRAPYVAFLNNDARPDPGWLGPLVALMEAEPDVAATASLVLDEEGRRVDFGGAGMTPFGRGIQLGFGEPRPEGRADPAPVLFSNGAAMLVRRETFLEVGGFDDRFFAYYEDVDLGWRLWVLGWRVMFVPGSVVYHRHHGSSSRFEPGLLDALMTRNAVMTAVKNYGDDILARLLPVLLLLEARRTQLAPPSVAARFHPSGRDVIGAMQRARYADQLGFGGSFRAALLAVARRRPEAGLALARALIRALVPRGHVVGPRGVAQAVALGDLLDVWPQLMEERGRIQSRRRRPDEAITPLFHLEVQRRAPRSARLRSDETTEAAYQALEAIGLHALLPRE